MEINNLKIMLMQSHGFIEKRKVHAQSRKNIRKEIARLKTKENEKTKKNN